MYLPSTGIFVTLLKFFLILATLNFAASVFFTDTLYFFFESREYTVKENFAYKGKSISLIHIPTCSLVHTLIEESISRFSQNIFCCKTVVFFFFGAMILALGPTRPIHNRKRKCWLCHLMKILIPHRMYSLLFLQYNLSLNSLN